MLAFGLSDSNSFGHVRYFWSVFLVVVVWFVTVPPHGRFDMQHHHMDYVTVSLTDSCCDHRRWFPESANQSF